MKILCENAYGFKVFKTRYSFLPKCICSILRLYTYLKVTEMKYAFAAHFYLGR